MSLTQENEARQHSWSPLTRTMTVGGKRIEPVKNLSLRDVDYFSFVTGLKPNLCRAVTTQGQRGLQLVETPRYKRFRFRVT